MSLRYFLFFLLSDGGKTNKKQKTQRSLFLIPRHSLVNPRPQGSFTFLTPPAICWKLPRETNTPGVKPANSLLNVT